MNKSHNPIGVFDSGLGGITVLGELKKLMPNENFIYLGDSKNAPYGTKNEDEIKEHTTSCIKKLISMGVKAVVIACNTATSVAAYDLREAFSIPIIGIEPAVKPAALKYEGENIFVMATPMTLKKEKFLKLMKSYEK
ncbi:MAG: aspartate/glutamate racemase family protein, partial [Clostridia bacterium]|nr:aspartate/glutamate racemase family protein [Clostridia bacterium]